ncbi:hypothetical protein TNCV_3763931 [Trichonephila clavipes]|uniref:Uncharacterized protein n=1 Tax=Trichonephila clavipes TaxID=2585209 RepID=A0A8X6VV86_TRICX|nr:hypothetical protein TNCV_3763931 [Trichonephila clavipes]
MIRWVLKLAEFNIEWKHRPCNKNTVADVLSRNSIGSIIAEKVNCTIIRDWVLSSRDQLIEEQRTDPELGHIYRYLENPEDSSVNATICRKLITPFQKLVIVSDGTKIAVGDIERLYEEARRNRKAKHEKWEKYYNRHRRDVQIKVRRTRKEGSEHIVHKRTLSSNDTNSDSPKNRNKSRTEKSANPTTRGYNLRPRNGKGGESRPTIKRKTQQGGPVRSRKGRGRNDSPYIEERTSSSNKNVRRGGDQQRQDQERRGACTEKSLSLEDLVGNANYKSIKPGCIVSFYILSNKWSRKNYCNEASHGRIFKI